MPTVSECVCCMEIDKVQDVMKETNPAVPCITILSISSIYIYYLESCTCCQVVWLLLLFTSLYLALPCSKTVLESGKNMARRIF
jgi:hypothetical protein